MIKSCKKGALGGGINPWSKNKVPLKALIIDRHISIIKFLKEEHPDVNHEFDPWHKHTAVSPTVGCTITRVTATHTAYQINLPERRAKKVIFCHKSIEFSTFQRQEMPSEVDLFWFFFLRFWPLFAAPESNQIWYLKFKIWDLEIKIYLVD